VGWYGCCGEFRAISCAVDRAVGSAVCQSLSCHVCLNEMIAIAFEYRDAMTSRGCTHSLAFFFGPGLPRSLGGASGSIVGAALFRPVGAAPPLFRLPSTLPGGASEFGSGVPAVTAGTGTEVSSDDLSAGEASGWVGNAVASGLGIGADEEAVGFVEGVCGKRASAVGDRVRVTILVFRAALDAGLAVVDMVGR
jgi:hypothetical protein